MIFIKGAIASPGYRGYELVITVILKFIPALPHRLEGKGSLGNRMVILLYIIKLKYPDAILVIS
jgi:hypothetical protein